VANELRRDAALPVACGPKTIIFWVQSEVVGISSVSLTEPSVE
jgi:hypothetical protein